ncbi:MAG TPA: DUF5687 family protein [Puia sp.]|jgi:hypothetical protein|nr:DUF5687 family protein [Puia sp.]
MILTLLSHQWKSFWRRRGAGRNLALQLLFGFMILYLLGCALFLGFALKHLLQQLLPHQDIIDTFCSFILYYFGIDIILRLAMQELPVLTVTPYLSQNIRRRQLVSFLNIRSLFHFFNFLPLILFFPFIFTVILPVYGWPTTIAFTIAILSLTAFNHFLLLYIKRKLIINSWWLIGFIGLLLVFCILDRMKILPVRNISTTVFTRCLHLPWLVVVPILAAMLAFVVNRRMLLRNLYVEEIRSAQKSRRSLDYAWLRHWGAVGDLMALDFRLIARNRRPRSVVLIAVAFLMYGFIFYQPRNLDPMRFGLMLFCGLFMTGLFLINYGRWGFAWQSGHFDGLLASNLSVEEYIRGKATLYTLGTTLAFIITTAYGFIDRRIVPIEAAAWLYNIGVTVPLSLWASMFNSRAIDIDKSAMFNYQGTGGAEMLYSVIVFLSPFAIYLPVSLVFNSWTGIAAIAAAGAIGLLFRGRLIVLLKKEFYKRKYLMLQGFREK